MDGSVGASRAQAPQLGTGGLYIHLIDDDLAFFRIERAARREFRQSALCGPLVFIGLDVISGGTVVLLRTLAINDGMQGHALFGEGIVGHQAFIGKEPQQGAVLYLPDEGGKGVRLTVQLAYLLAGRFILGRRSGQIPGAFAGFLRPAAQGVAFRQDDAQPGKDLVAQGALILLRLMLAKKEGMQVGAGLIKHDGAEHGREAVKNL